MEKQIKPTLLVLAESYITGGGKVRGVFEDSPEGRYALIDFCHNKIHSLTDHIGKSAFIVDKALFYKTVNEQTSIFSKKCVIKSVNHSISQMLRELAKKGYAGAKECAEEASVVEEHAEKIRYQESKHKFLKLYAVKENDKYCRLTSYRKHVLVENVEQADIFSSKEHAEFYSQQNMETYDGLELQIVECWEELPSFVKISSACLGHGQSQESIIKLQKGNLCLALSKAQ